MIYQVLVTVRVYNDEGKILPEEYAPAKRWVGDFKTEDEARKRVQTLENYSLDKLGADELEIPTTK